MCSISFNIYRMKLNKGYFSLGTVIILFLDKPYQEKISKVIWIVYYFANKEKYCQNYTCPKWFCFTLLVCAHVCDEIEKCQL